MSNCCIDASAYADLKAAVTAAGSSETNICICDPVFLADTSTAVVNVPSNVVLDFKSDGFIKLQGVNATLNLETQINADRRTIFEAGLEVTCSPLMNKAFPEWFGDTSGNSEVFFQKGLDIAHILDLSPGVNYTLNNQVNLKSNRTIEGNNAKVTASFSGFPFILGSHSNSFLMPTLTALTQDVAYGQYYFEIPSGFSVAEGDVVVLGADNFWNPPYIGTDPEGPKIGQLNRVTRVAGSTAYIDSIAYGDLYQVDGYTVANEAYVANLTQDAAINWERNISIRNLQGETNNLGSSGFIMAQYAENLCIENVHVHSPNLAGGQVFSFLACLDVRVSDSSMSQYFDWGSGTMPDSYGLIMFKGTRNMLVENCNFIGFKHQFIIGTGLNWLGRDITLRSCTFSRALWSAVSTHYQGQNIVVDDCKFFDSFGVSVSGTLDFLIRNCLFYDGTYVNISHGSKQTSIVGNNFTRASVRITDNFQLVQVDQVTITNNEFFEQDDDGIRITANVRDVIISNNSFLSCNSGIRVRNNQGLPEPMAMNHLQVNGNIFRQCNYLVLIAESYHVTQFTFSNNQADNGEVLAQDKVFFVVATNNSVLQTLIMRFEQDVDAVTFSNNQVNQQIGPVIRLEKQENIRNLMITNNQVYLKGDTVSSSHVLYATPPDAGNMVISQMMIANNLISGVGNFSRAFTFNQGSGGHNCAVTTGNVTNNIFNGINAAFQLTGLSLPNEGYVWGNIYRNTGGKYCDSDTRSACP